MQFVAKDRSELPTGTQFADDSTRRSRSVAFSEVVSRQASQERAGTSQIRVMSGTLLLHVERFEQHPRTVHAK